eukprot:NODE_67_length_2278_cov_728.590643.p1 GENE.NODE_67_length_2278_cov_728.590643~~NODE_67_length_2278_cov_728.590643.p1  ORF type:complete len:592 (-),score=175.36 NODE_67_length_2278_cov_728.590643:369-2144(-)
MRGADASFNVLEFYIEEIRHESTMIKINAVNNMMLIASALGPQRTAKELVPFVASVIHEEPLCHDEEFLFGMAKQYKLLSDDHDSVDVMLFEPLEHLAAKEETVIRDEAVASLIHIVKRRPSLAPEYLVPALHRLATKTDLFTARVSACALLSTAYQYADANQKERLRKTFTSLCSDDTPMVRRAAAHKTCDVFAVCDKADLLTHMMPVYKQLSQEDAQDTIRVACALSVLVLAGMLNTEENRQHAMPIFKELAEDRSWQVRLTVVRNIHQLCEAVGPELTASHIIGPFVQMLRDSVQEVRKEAVRVIENCLQGKQPLSSEQLQTHFLPLFTTLGIDAAQSVRAAVAQIIGPVAHTVGRDVTQRVLLPIISDLMKDEFHDVRLNVVSHSGLICEVLGPDTLVHSLLPAIQSLTMDNHWRIRQSVVEQMPRLARLFGAELFGSKLEPHFLSGLRDSVHSVRQASIAQLKEIAEAFGRQWVVDHLLPKLVDQYSQSAGYANRVTTLQLLPQVSGVMAPNQVELFVVPLLVRATKDTVPNVRFCACRNLMWIMEHGPPGAHCVADLVKPTLQELLHDADSDVQFYAKRALTCCQ